MKMNNSVLRIRQPYNYKVPGFLTLCFQLYIVSEEEEEQKSDLLGFMGFHAC